jgi:hypothetical protein
MCVNAVDKGDSTRFGVKAVDKRSYSKLEKRKSKLAGKRALRS